MTASAVGPLGVQPPQAELRRPQRRASPPTTALGPPWAGAGSSSRQAAAAAGGPPAPAAGAEELDEILKLVALLPLGVRATLEQHPRLAELLEVVLDLGRPPVARFPGGDLRLAEQPVTPDDLQYAVAQVGAAA